MLWSGGFQASAEDKGDKVGSRTCMVLYTTGGVMRVYAAAKAVGARSAVGELIGGLQQL